MSNYLDSRDLIARRDELIEERDGFAVEVDGEEVKDAEAWANGNPEDADELDALIALCNECEGYGDWEHGETLIPESEWVDYVKELVADCGDIPRGVPDYIVIDWEATAENIAADYMTVDYLGETYYIRA